MRATWNLRRSQRTEQIRRRSSSDASPLCLYASWRAPGSAQVRAPRVGLGDRKAKRPGTPVWISLSRGTARSRLFMFTSTRRPHDVRNGIKSSLQSSALIPPQQVCTWARASAAGGGAGIAHIPSGPRAIATTPVRDTSTRPTGSIRLMKLSIFSEAPVISNTKCSVVASMTRARNASASRNASIR